MNTSTSSQERTLTRSRQYFERAKKVVPSTTNTLSRGPQNWIQGVTPNFIQRGEGAYVYDVDGNRYIDYASGLGPYILGYGHPAVNDAVKKQLEDGHVFGLCHPLEVELSELLCELIPCAEMVRMGRNGSDVTSIAVRLSRAHTGRDVVLCGGYHGFQDWYIGSTERNAGIPQAVRDLTKPFSYNDLDGLRMLLAENEGNVACVIMEPVYVEEPHPGYLETVKELVHEAGAVLVFDEIITGFRWSMGGAQEYFGVTPDLACFGKAMANGSPISALVGKREVMKDFDDKNVFYSCTFSGETTGMAASVACINYMRDNDVIGKIWENGKHLQERFNALTEKLGISYISIEGYAPKTTVTFKAAGSYDYSEIKSLFQQECIRHGLLFIGYHFMNLAHTQEIIDDTMPIYERVLQLVDKAIEEGNVVELLEGPALKSIFANVGDRSGGPSLGDTDA